MKKQKPSADPRQFPAPPRRSTSTITIRRVRIPRDRDRARARRCRVELHVDEIRIPRHGGVLHARQRGGNLPKQRLDIEPRLRAGLDEHDIVLPRLPFPLLDADLPLIDLVGFVPYEDEDDVGAALVPDLVDPFGGGEEGCAVGDVVDDDGDGGVADVGGDEGAEALLSGGVPELEADGAVFEVHGFGEEVDADGGLVVVVEFVVHEARDDGGFADGLVAEEDELVLGERGHRAGAWLGGHGEGGGGRCRGE
mmetsp:Transcript_7344/g.17995  ORF Transcript_7344/g.17995 Transcript_7344/m.17995 type:complete len:252 (+) Transcript_7344:347-1102(+)